MPKKDPTYSDADSTYWPPGWNYERFEIADRDDVNSLPTDELEKMQAGLREVLGEQGQLVKDVSSTEAETALGSKGEEVTANETKVNGSSDAPTNTADAAQLQVLQRPSWLTQYNKRYQGGTWGFIAFQTTCYDSEERWKEFKARIDSFTREIFDRDARDSAVADEIGIARKNFRIQWIEDPVLADASGTTLRDRYEKLKPDAAPGMLQDFFLCASPQAFESVMSVGDKADKQITELKRRRSDTPFLLAVTMYPDPIPEQEGEDYEFRRMAKPAFKVSVETLIDELWWQVDADMRPVDQLARRVKPSGELGDICEVHPRETQDVWSSMAPDSDRLHRRMRLRGLPV